MVFPVGGAAFDAGKEKGECAGRKRVISLITHFLDVLKFKVKEGHQPRITHVRMVSSLYKMFGHSQAFYNSKDSRPRKREDLAMETEKCAYTAQTNNVMNELASLVENGWNEQQIARLARLRATYRCTTDTLAKEAVNFLSKTDQQHLIFMR